MTRPSIDPRRVRDLQAYALANPLAEAGTALGHRHFIDVHDGRSDAGLRVALSLNK